MAIPYVPPGVTVTEQVTNSVAPFLTPPTTLCLVGYSQGTIKLTDTVILSGQQQIALPRLPNNATSAQVDVVKDVLNPGTGNSSSGAWVNTTDYVFTTNGSPASTTLTANIDSLLSTTVVTVGSTTSFPASGTIIIDNEYITYTAKTSTTFTGCVRGVNGTTPAAHATAATAVQPKFVLARAGSPSGYVGDPATVGVTYEYTPPDYFVAKTFTDYNDILAKYGTALTPDGQNISSPLSFAALVAFENGATSIVCQPLFYNNSGVRTQPTITSSSTTGSWANSSTWNDSLIGLRDNEDINVIVPIVGQSQAFVGDAETLAVFQKVQDHQTFMLSQQDYVFGIYGEDSSASTSVATLATLQSHASTLQSRYGGVLNQQNMMLSPSRLLRLLPSSAQNFLIGAQYAAAAIGGMLSGRRVSQSLTRQVLTGFVDIPDFRTEAQRNADAQAGLTVLAVRNGTVQVRHEVTMDSTSTARREVPVVRAKFRMIASVQATLEDSIIGQTIADDLAPSTVMSAVIGVLQALQDNKDLVSFANVQARTLTLDPTTVEVRFSYKPSFPLNYVNIGFNLDLSSQTATVVGP